MVRPQPDTLIPYLRRSRYVGLVGTATAAFTWTVFLAWASFARPERLGPARLLAAQALVVATAASLVMWWTSALFLRQRLAQVVDEATPDRGGQRLRSVDTGR